LPQKVQPKAPTGLPYRKSVAQKSSFNEKSTTLESFMTYSG